MRKIYFLQLKTSFLVTFLFFSLLLNSQVFTDSNLPIVLINTDVDPFTNLPREILDDPRVLASMKIIKHSDGSRNYLSDQNNAAFLNYNGRINIEIRGSSSQVLPKKPYALTTLLADNTSNNNVSLLGMPSENDWVLNSLAFDQSLIRDYLAYNLSRQMGNYAVRTNYCEVVVNGEYVGLYMLTENIKADSNRVNIVKITTTDNSASSLTGGYITKADKTTGGDPVAWSNISYTGQYVDYIHELPKPDEVTFFQNTYINGVFNNFQSAVSANNTSLINGYTNFIDVPTFVDFMVSNEFAANADGYQLSTFFHKDRSGKLRAGPIWDFNLTLGNDLFFWGFDRSKYDTWQFSNGDNEGSQFWTDLFNNTEFKCYFAKRFHSLTQSGQPMNATVLNTFIDNTIVLISEAMVREHQKWNTIPDNALEITNLKNFIAARIAWMTTNLGGFSTCSNVVTPSLVISQINYNPSVSGSFPESNDQEFIQITNSGSSTINLSGIYFSQLGVSYQFPYNSTISGNSSIYLAANSTVFQNQNGFAAFGQFTRNLSNKSQKIAISDAFGNVIDTVEYFDTNGWPTAADGNGSYLQLINTNLDNNIASSWVASSSTLNGLDFNANATVSIYPNPANDVLTITSQTNIDKIAIFDVSGKLLQTINVNATEIETDISSLQSGVYVLKIYSDYGVITKRLIKK